VLANAIVLLGPAAARAEDVSIDQVPPAVRATIEREALGGRIDDIERETKDGRVVYEVEFEQGGRDYEIHVAGDGSLLTRRED
jgi:hypothetical protein